MVGANTDRGDIAVMVFLLIIVLLTIITVLCAALIFADETAFQEQKSELRKKLEVMLIHDEAGSETVTAFLTVQHDGHGLVVAAGHEIVPADNLDIGDTISLRRASNFFSADVKRAIEIARRVVPDFDSHPEDARVVLAGLAYQMGEGGLREFKRMLAAIAVRDYHVAAAELLSSKLAREDSPNRAAREAKRLREAK